MNPMETLAQFNALVWEMAEAQRDYGCGYYNSPRWLAAYRALKDLANAPSEDD